MYFSCWQEHTHFPLAISVLRSIFFNFDAQRVTLQKGHAVKFTFWLDKHSHMTYETTTIIPLHIDMVCVLIMKCVCVAFFLLFMNNIWVWNKDGWMIYTYPGIWDANTQHAANMIHTHLIYINRTLNKQYQCIKQFYKQLNWLLNEAVLCS